MFIFSYGPMGAGKSTAALQINFSLKEAGFKTLLLKPRIDTRTEDTIKSRIGLEEKCKFVPNTDSAKELMDTINDIIIADYVIVDEAQFLTRKQVEYLAWIVDELNKDVYCYGLRTSYTGELFEGTAALFALADQLIELPLMYSDGNKAIAHIRYIDGEPIFDGDPIYVGDIKSDYESVSRKQYFLVKHKKVLN